MARSPTVFLVHTTNGSKTKNGRYPWEEPTTTSPKPFTSAVQETRGDNDTNTKTDGNSNEDDVSDSSVPVRSWGCAVLPSQIPIFAAPLRTKPCHNRFQFDDGDSDSNSDADSEDEDEEQILRCVAAAIPVSMRKNTKPRMPKIKKP